MVPGKTYGPSLTSFKDGKDLTIDLGGADAVMNMQWNENELYWFQKQSRSCFRRKRERNCVGLMCRSPWMSVATTRRQDEVGDWCHVYKGKKILIPTRLISWSATILLRPRRDRDWSIKCEDGGDGVFRCRHSWWSKLNGQDSKIWRRRMRSRMT